ncbi:MAG: carboxypeptidase-like regulatory domain-containing protein [Bacteroidetes bacterium]|nr:MAG: carboxypeptidase-like regulatory domain-containing protein [Bacteroidota bacterium]TNE96576.1 MAG: carboxypeptidase-like regulatory domain-containing protein [Bacteroidota bacterium]
MRLLLLLSICISTIALGQKTLVEGIVRDQLTGDPMPFVTVRFQDSKIGAFTDTSGYYRLDTYYATDSLIFSFSGYITKTVGVQKDIAQEINITLEVRQTDVQEVFVRPPDEFPSTVLHKKVIAHKPINDKEKLMSYEYEVYNKIQLDLNNIGDKFKENDLIKRLDVVLDYLDSAENGKSYLPAILSESVSDFYFKNNPKKKKEVVKATRISGVDNLQLNQFLGDMYLDVNVYDNYIVLFNKAFVSPAANNARSFYRFYLEDSTFIGNQWCYKLTFKPKRKGDMVFEGEMWIHDTTYAIKQFKANIAPWANINYVQGLYIEHEFDMVAPEVWMLTSEKMIVDLKITKKSAVYGFFGRRHSTRKNFVINEGRPENFYASDNNVEIQEGAKDRSDAFWDSIRHEPLSTQEAGIDQMIDSLENTRLFRNLKNLMYFATTGYYPIGKIEIGSAFSLVSLNPVEKFRTALALRTSNDFSRRIELGGNVAYGFGDERFKYGAKIRLHLARKKRALLTAYYNYDIEQIGQSPTAAAIGSTFGTLLLTGALDKLTFVTRVGLNLEKDVGKDLILFGSFETKEYVPLGIANYVRETTTGVFDTISRINTSEITARFRWGKNEEFISGSFDRTSVGSRFPILSFQATFGIKDLLGADYNYQKFDFVVEHNRTIGFLGRIRYSLNLGYITGTAAYPFLKVHEGNQSYWLMTNAFNKMNFFEFISDKYATLWIENHWDGLILDRIPLVRRLKWRLVSTIRMAYGQIDDRHLQEMIIPDFTKKFGDTPYTEVGLGIENIFLVGRVDVFWRLTHLDPGVKVGDIQNFGVRARYAINF